jgi:hypothetical protein
MKDISKESIDAAKHMPAHDGTRINHAIEKAARNPEFINRALAQLAGLRFPAFKNNIIDHVKSINTHDEEDVVALFESLDGYIQYRNEYHVQKAIEENVPAKKKDNQITDNTRENPDVQFRQTSADSLATSAVRNSKISKIWCITRSLKAALLQHRAKKIMLY